MGNENLLIGNGYGYGGGYGYGYGNGNGYGNDYYVLPPWLVLTHVGTPDLAALVLVVLRKGATDFST